MKLVCPFVATSPQMQMPLHETILQNINSFQHETALIDAETGHSYSYLELRRLSASVAHTFHGRFRLQKGDIVAVYLENRAEYAMIFLGVTAIGGIVTGINPLSTVEELQRQLVDSAARFMITRRDLVPKVYETTKGLRIEHIFTYDAAAMQIFTHDTSESINETKLLPLIPILFSNPSDSFPYVQIDPMKDVATLPYSSGTTGYPKGRGLTYQVVAGQKPMLRCTIKLKRAGERK